MASGSRRSTATPISALFGEPKTFSRVELEGVILPQNKLADLLFGRVKGGAMRLERIALKQARLEGPVTFHAIDVEAELAVGGSVRSARATGAEPTRVEYALTTPRTDDTAVGGMPSPVQAPPLVGLEEVTNG